MGREPWVTGYGLGVRGYGYKVVGKQRSEGISEVQTQGQQAMAGIQEIDRQTDRQTDREREEVERVHTCVGSECQPTRALVFLSG